MWFLLLLNFLTLKSPWSQIPHTMIPKEMSTHTCEISKFTMATQNFFQAGLLTSISYSTNVQGLPVVVYKNIGFSHPTHLLANGIRLIGQVWRYVKKFIVDIWSTKTYFRVGLDSVSLAQLLKSSPLQEMQITDWWDWNHYCLQLKFETESVAPVSRHSPAFSKFLGCCSW